MSSMLIVTLTFLIIGGVQLYILFKKRLVKEAIVSLILFVIALIYAYGEVFFWELPGPSRFIHLTFQPLVKLIFGVSLK